MSFILSRDCESSSYYFTTDQWAICLKLMQAHGWIPQGTQRYEVHEVVGPLDSVLKDDSYAVPVADAIAAGLSPESLARYISERSENLYDSLLEEFRKQWESGELWIPSTLDRKWSGSYALNESQYVASEDAGHMAEALIRAANAMESDSASPQKTHVQAFGFMEANGDEKSHWVAEGPDACRRLADWMKRGEFRIC